jgi:hypothetical protein
MNTKITEAEIENQRWIDFSLRMAKTCYRHSQRPSLAWIIDSINDIFETINDDLSLYKSWDNVLPYSENDEIYTWKKYNKDKPQYPIHLSTVISECIEQNIYWSPYEHANRSQRKVIDKYRDSMSDEEYDILKERIVSDWSSPVHCCIRAGIDMAKGGNFGVIGFTFEEVVNMYPEGLPDWIKDDLLPGIKPKDLIIL